MANLLLGEYAIRECYIKAVISMQLWIQSNCELKQQNK